MTRLVAVVALIAILVGLHEPYRRSTVPTLVNGDELSVMRPGLVTFNGTVLSGHIDDRGGKVLTLQVDNSQVIAYIGPTLSIGLPKVGAYCSITGKMLGAGAVSLESEEDMRVLLPIGGLVYQPTDKPGAPNERCEISIERVILGSVTKRGDSRYIAFSSMGRLYHGFAPLDMTAKVAILQGYTNEHGIFVVEGYR
jgi:hypothetical protein